jgi:hypothetical protein
MNKRKVDLVVENSNKKPKVEYNNEQKKIEAYLKKFDSERIQKLDEINLKQLFDIPFYSAKSSIDALISTASEIRDIPSYFTAIMKKRFPSLPPRETLQSSGGEKSNPMDSIDTFSIEEDSQFFSLTSESEEIPSPEPISEAMKLVLELKKQVENQEKTINNLKKRILILESKNDYSDESILNKVTNFL